MIETIEKYKGYEILILAHSMGSIIAFDVLTFLRPETPIHTFVTIGSPLGLPVVVSKIASEYKKKTNGKTLMATPPGVQKNWFNLADISDNVALNYKLNDDFSPNTHGVAPIDFLVVNDYEIQNKRNPHKSFGYLRSSEMSAIVNEFIAKNRNFMGNKWLNRMEEVLEKIKLRATKAGHRVGFRKKNIK